MTRFRPCIDLHHGVVKQIVGGTLSNDATALKTNFIAEHPPAWYAERYRADGLDGGHVIQLGPGNAAAAKAALAAWPDGLHVGGGINAETAGPWIRAGAQKVIVTSWLFPAGQFAPERVTALINAVGEPRLVIDLSCRRRADRWLVAIDRWQTVIEYELSPQHLAELGSRCSEFLIHAADVEGLCQGIDEELVELLGKHSPIPCVYAGGGRSIEDLARVERLSQGRVDLTFGSALDLFGGTGVGYADCLKWNREHP